MDKRDQTLPSEEVCEDHSGSRVLKVSKGRRFTDGVPVCSRQFACGYSIGDWRRRNHIVHGCERCMSNCNLNPEADVNSVLSMRYECPMMKMEVLNGSWSKEAKKSLSESCSFAFQSSLLFLFHYVTNTIINIGLAWIMATRCCL